MADKTTLARFQARAKYPAFGIMLNIRNDFKNAKLTGHTENEKIIMKLELLNAINNKILANDDIFPGKLQHEIGEVVAFYDTLQAFAKANYGINNAKLKTADINYFYDNIKHFATVYVNNRIAIEKGRM